MDFENFRKKIKEVFIKYLQIDLSENLINEKSQKFFDFMNLLVEKNKVMNLTTIVEPDEIIMRHFIDSCYFLKWLEKERKIKKKEKDKYSILDVGTGAGFPGIPLAIMDDIDEFVLSDTLGKRINFLEEVVEKLQLKNVRLVKARAEDLAKDKNYREKFDFVLSRGVAKISVLSEYSLPFVRIGGQMVAYKLDDCEEELKDGEKAIKILGGVFHVKQSYELIDNEPKRCLVVIDKKNVTPNKYPRQAGMPNKKPINR